jgi:hypothetical protein
MSIADEKGKVYKVHKPEELLTTANNDELMAVLKYTYISKCWNQDLKGLIAKGLVDNDPENNVDDLVNSLNEGVEYLQNHLSLIFSPEEISAELIDVRKNMYGRKHSIHDN